MPVDYQALREDAHHLARQFFGERAPRVHSFTNRIMDVCVRVQDKDFLLIRNPGGWGSKTLEQCLHWERSIVAGISSTLEQLGYTFFLVQYLRSGNDWREWLRDMREQIRFFTNKARVMAAEVELITRHLDHLNVILIGASQGAAFSNAVMQNITDRQRVYSVELGMFFPHVPRRVVTERTLAIDSNGMVPDAAASLDIKACTTACLAAPFQWLGHHLRGRPVSFSQCVNVRGHHYDWGQSYVQRQVVDFLKANFGTK